MIARQSESKKQQQYFKEQAHAESNDDLGVCLKVLLDLTPESHLYWPEHTDNQRGCRSDDQNGELCSADLS